MKKNPNNANEALNFSANACEKIESSRKSGKIFPDWVFPASFIACPLCFPLVGLFGGWAALGLLVFGVVAVLSGGERM